MRKCVRGDRVTYSNLTCPPGFRERTVSEDRVTVVPAIKATTSTPAPSGTSPHEKMREALDIQPDDKLRQRMIDRAVDSPPR